MEIACCEEIPRSRILSLPQSWFLCVMCFQGASQPQLKSFPSLAMSSSFSQLIPWLPTLTEKPTGIGPETTGSCISKYISVYAHPSLLSPGCQEVTVFPLFWLNFHLCPSPVALTTPPLLDLDRSPQFVKKAKASHFNRLHLTLQPFLTSATSGPSKARFLKG